MEPLRYDLSKTRLIPTTCGFSEELGKAIAQQEAAIVFGFEPGELETSGLAYPLQDRIIQSAQDPIARAAAEIRKGFRCFVFVAGVEALHRGWQELYHAARLKLDFKVIQVSGGLQKGENDPSPAVVEDLGLISSIPYLPIIVPGDAIEARAVARWAAENSGPAYIRLSTAPTPTFLNQFLEFNYGIAGTLTRQGWDVTIVGNGPTVGTLVRMIEDLELENISARIMNISTLRPLDRSGILRAVQDTRRILSVEEHHLSTGMASMIAQVLGDEPVPHRFRSLGIRNEFVPHPLPGDPLRYYGLRAEDIRNAVRELIQSPV